MTSRPWLVLALLCSACGSGEDPAPAAPGPRPGTDSGSGFVLKGRVANIGTSGRGLSTAQVSPSDRRITDVLALNPSSLNPARRSARINEDGSFQLSLEVGRPWLIELIDRGQVGPAMVVSVFRAETLDALVPTSSGTLDLGMVSTSTQVAQSGVAYGEVLAALGLAEADALNLGAVDDLCLRYVNPDVDGNGVVDFEQPDVDFRLDLHVGLQTRIAGRPSHVGDLVGAFFDEVSTTIEHQQTGIYTSFRSNFTSADPATGRVLFDEPINLVAFGPSGPSNHTMPGDTPITGGDLIVGNYGEMRSLGVAAQAGPDLPQGRYRFGIGGNELTFTEVHTRSGAELMAAEGFVLPFLRIDPVDPNCNQDCVIASVSFRWMRHDHAGWAEATQADRALFVDPQGGFVSIVYNQDNSPARLGITIPADAAFGTIPWTPANVRLENLSEAELLGMRSDQVCHLGLSVDDLLGMRYFLGIQNAPGTCN